MRMLSELQFLPADQLVPLVGNPNSVGPEVMDQLKASLLQHGLLEPFILQAETLVVVGGNHRLIAVKELIAEGALPADSIFPCGVFTFTADQLKRAAVALNKVQGDIGAAALRDFLDGVDFADEAMLLGTGLDATELDFLRSTPWAADDLFSRSFVVKGKRSPRGPAPPQEPAETEEPVCLNKCPACGHEY